MKNKIINFLVLCVTVLCLFAFVGCEPSSNPPSDPPPVNAETWETAFTVDDAEFSYSLNVGDTHITVLVDGENVRRQESVGDTTTLSFVFKDESGFYTATPFDYWKQYQHPVYNWGEYKQRVSSTQADRDAIKNEYLEYMPEVLTFGDFSWDKTDKVFKAASVQSGDQTLSDVRIEFGEDSRVKQISYTVPDGDVAKEISIAFSFGAVTIPEPAGFVTEADESMRGEFDFIYDNVYAVYDRYVSGYVYPETCEYTKSGDKIRIREKTSWDDDFTSETYYDKEGYSCYKYTYVNGVWYKVQIATKTYNEVLNKLYTIVVNHNHNYSFDKLGPSGMNAVYITGGSGGTDGTTDMMTFFCVDKKIIKVVVGPTKFSASEGPTAQINLTYGNAVVTIPEHSVATAQIQAAEDWKSNFFAENYTDFTAKITDGNGNVSAYIRDENNGVVTVYVKQTYPSYKEEYLQKTSEKYIYEKRTSANGSWSKSEGSISRTDYTTKQAYERMLNYNYICPDFSNNYNVFEYNEIANTYEFSKVDYCYRVSNPNAEQQECIQNNDICPHGKTLYSNTGMMTVYQTTYSNVVLKINDENRIVKWVLSDDKTTPNTYTIELSKIGQSSLTLPR